MAKSRSAPGGTKLVVIYLLLEEQLGLRDLESTELARHGDHLFPAAVALDGNGHAIAGTKFESHMGQPHIGNGEDIYSTSEHAHHLSNDHNTTFKNHSEGSANGNVHSENTSCNGRESPRITKEENITDFMRDHPPPVQVVPHIRGYRSCFV